MSNYHLTLFCLVDGEATSNAFPVSASAKTTVGELKDSIKSKKTIDFSDIDADKLILWRVSIPITDEDDEVPIILNSFDKRKLGPVTRLSKVFPEDLPEETIHIIVQRPPPVRAESYNWASTVTKPHHEKRSSLGFHKAVVCWTLDRFHGLRSHNGVKASPSISTAKVQGRQDISTGGDSP
ncbi:hypothetical protein BGZ90_008718 [Linnemannia elongata]|nr:hypothetical protein BGZ90_008718 [Linnemannia elongata]